MRLLIVVILFQGSFASHCQYAEVSCAGTNEQACNSMNVDFLGCPTSQGFCAPVYADWETDRLGNPCPNHCPIECPLDQVVCPGQFNSDGCRMPDYCVSYHQACAGEYYDSNGCPPALQWIDCPEGYLSCAGGYDADGCMTDALCIPDDGQCPEPMYDHRGCPITSNPPCADNEFHCGFDFDQRGCEIDLGCMPSLEECPMPTMDSNGCMILPPVNCEEDSVQCPMNFDHKGCPLSAPTCVPMDNGDCYPESSCPVECSEHDMPCTFEYEQCTETHCFPATTPNEFNPGTCNAYCPVQCNWETELECMGQLDASGCRGPSFCAPVDQGCPEEVYDWMGCMVMNDWPECGPEEQMCEILDQDGCVSSRTCEPMMDPNGCPLMCPMSCSAHEYSCPAQTLEGDMCPMPDSCFPIMEGLFGGQCPPVCPVMCGENEVTCHNGFDADGCDLGETCVPVGDNCPAVCPAQCGPNEMSCEMVDPQSGCRMDSYCIEMSYEGPRGDMCPSVCHVPCGENEMPCPGGFDSQGCLLPDLCVPMDGECPQGEFNEMGCPVFEPPVCGHNEMACVSGHDEFFCPLGPDFCVSVDESCPAACNSFEMECSDSQGYSFCAPTSYPNHQGEDCPASCPVDCDWDTEYMCPGGFDSNGCANPDVCVPHDSLCPVEEFDAMGCPMLAEPIECNWNEEHVCNGGFDPKGCMMPDFCLPNDTECPESEYDSQGCRTDVYQALECAANEMMCDMGYDPQTHCYLGATCEPMYVGNCLNMCPTLFDEYMPGTVCPGGVEPNFGCPLESYIVPEGEQCAF